MRHEPFNTLSEMLKSYRSITRCETKLLKAWNETMNLSKTDANLWWSLLTAPSYSLDSWQQVCIQLWLENLVNIKSPPKKQLLHTVQCKCEFFHKRSLITAIFVCIQIIDGNCLWTPRRDFLFLSHLSVFYTSQAAFVFNRVPGYPHAVSIRHRYRSVLSG